MGIKLLSAIAVALAVGTSAHATEFVQNGGFETLGAGAPASGSFEFGASYKYANGVANWTSASSNAFNVYFVNNGTATTTDADTRFSPANGGEHGQFLYSIPGGASPQGGNFVALDGDGGYNGAITQTVTGLTVGQTYTLTFDWAAAQYADRTGATTEQIQYSLGGQTFSTAIVDNASAGSNGWFTESHTFTANNTSEVLSFLSVGTPSGLPPVALLDGVSLTGGVPEPATWAMMLVGFGGLGALLRQRRRLVSAA
jgi:hypothetical protein